MASIDKTSVRAEINRLKFDFEQLCADGKITNETKVIMSSMFMILELMLSFLNERLRRIIKTPAKKRVKYNIALYFSGRLELCQDRPNRILRRVLSRNESWQR